MKLPSEAQTFFERGLNGKGGRSVRKFVAVQGKRCDATTPPNWVLLRMRTPLGSARRKLNLTHHFAKAHGIRDFWSAQAMLAHSLRPALLTVKAGSTAAAIQKLWVWLSRRKGESMC